MFYILCYYICLKGSVIMAYYMMCEKRRGDYSLIDITKSNCFTKLSKFKNGGCDLREIDAFTTQFFDEEELREYLITQGLLSFDDVNKNLSIRKKNKDKYDKVRYDFLYQKDIDYIFNPNKIIDKILNKLYQGDFRFIQDFANNYMKYRECSSTMPEVRYYANESIKNGCISNGFSLVDENGDNLIRRAVKLLIYKYNQQLDGKLFYSNDIVYRNLHSIICFVNNYDKKHGNEVMKQDVKTLKKEANVGEQLSFL